MVLRNAILHIGMGKTGTTTIQFFLHKNAKRLREHNVAKFCPFDLKTYPQTAFRDIDRLYQGLDELKERTEQQGADSVVWSMEALGSLEFGNDRRKLEAIRRKLAGANITIVVYLRRQDSFAPSAYLQWNVLNKRYRGPVQSFDERFPAFYGEDNSCMLEGTNLNYYEVIRPWAEVFGVSNLRVRLLEKAQMVEGNLLHDFCAASGLPKVEYDFEVSRQNVTFNMELHDLLGMYNSVFEEPINPTEMRDFFGSFVYDEFFSRPFFTRFTIPPEKRLAILEGCEEFNAKVAREYLGREDGVLFREPWPSPDEPHQPYSGMTLEKLVPILLHILLKQHQEIARHSALLQQRPSLAKIVVGGVACVAQKVGSMFGAARRKSTRADLQPLAAHRVRAPIASAQSNVCAEPEVPLHG